jgi:hypothetical protein
VGARDDVDADSLNKGVGALARISRCGGTARGEAPALDEQHDDGSRRSGKRDEERDRERRRLEEREVDPIVVDDGRAADERGEDGPERQPELPRERASDDRVEDAVDRAEHRHREHELGRVERDDAYLEAVVGRHPDHVLG